MAADFNARGDLQTIRREATTIQLWRIHNVAAAGGSMPVTTRKRRRRICRVRPLPPLRLLENETVPFLL